MARAGRKRGKKERKPRRRHVRAHLWYMVCVCLYVSMRQGRKAWGQQEISGHILLSIVILW